MGELGRRFQRHMVLHGFAEATKESYTGAMRERIPTRADCPLCMGASRRSPVFSACQAAAQGYALSRLGGLRFAFDSSSESSIQRSASSLNLRKFASSAQTALRCPGRTYSERLRIRLMTSPTASASAETPRFHRIGRFLPKRLQCPLPSLPVFPFA